MTGEGGASDAGDGRRAGMSALARAWAAALHSADYVPMTPAERHAVLTGLAERLAAAVSAEPLNPATGYWVGADLVAAGFASPEALGRTITVMNTRLLGALGRAGNTTASARLTALIEALAAGFAAAVRDRSLDAQEALRLAALTAQVRAEHALRASEARFRHFATHDTLTGLPNRTYVIEQLNHVLAAATTGRLGVCCLELDGVKTVNDSLGYQVGDRLLVAAAERLRALLSTSGHLVARLDGDEFAIVIEQTTCAEDAVKVADQALAILTEPFHIGDHELLSCASAGIVERSADSTNPTEMIRAAEIALHWAKVDGKARWQVFDPDRNATDAARYRLSAAMPAALRRGKFILVYQPLVNLADGALAGAEALARWAHPEHGRLGADRFISLAEDTGLIVPLGANLLEQACQQAAMWQKLAASAPYVSVNLAARQLHQPGLVGHITQVLDYTGLVPHRLQLEVTEHTVIATDRETVATLHALADLGVRIAIDDFGTGYSNLACLRSLPLHALKLAGNLVQDASPPPAIDSAEDAFLTTVVSLGHTLGLNVTAEGIETAAQAQRMRAIGCDTGQGWHFGPPVPPEEITRVIA